MNEEQVNEKKTRMEKSIEDVYLNEIYFANENGQYERKNFSQLGNWVKARLCEVAIEQQYEINRLREEVDNLKALG